MAEIWWSPVFDAIPRSYARLQFGSRTRDSFPMLLMLLLFPSQSLEIWRAGKSGPCEMWCAPGVWLQRTHFEWSVRFGILVVGTGERSYSFDSTSPAVFTVSPNINLQGILPPSYLSISWHCNSIIVNNWSASSMFSPQCKKCGGGTALPD